jgi:hypothetical protein
VNKESNDFWYEVKTDIPKNPFEKFAKTPGLYRYYALAGIYWDNNRSTYYDNPYYIEYFELFSDNNNFIGLVLYTNKEY